MVKLFSKNSNLCDHNPPTLQTDRQTNRRTDRQTTCDRNTALCTKVHRAVKTWHWAVYGGRSPPSLPPWIHKRYVPKFVAYFVLGHPVCVLCLYNQSAPRCDRMYGTPCRMSTVRWPHYMTKINYVKVTYNQSSQKSALNVSLILANANDTRKLCYRKDERAMRAI